MIKVVKANFLMEISNGTQYVCMNDLYLCCGGYTHILDEILLLCCYSTQVNPYIQRTYNLLYEKSFIAFLYDDDDASTRHNTF